MEYRAFVPTKRRSQNMTFPSLKEVLALEPGTVVPGVQGSIAGVGERYPATGMAETQMSDGSKRLWSIQAVLLAQNGEQTEVEIQNKDPIGQDKVGASVYFISQQPPQGRLVGVKVDAKEGRKLIRVTSKGEMVFGQPANTIIAPVPTVPKPAPAAPATASISTPAATQQPIAQAPKTAPVLVVGNGWGVIIETLDGFAQLYALCQQRAVTVAESAGNVHCDPARIASDLFQAELAWLRGELPGELPKGTP